MMAQHLIGFLEALLLFADTALLSLPGAPFLPQSPVSLSRTPPLPNKPLVG